MRRNGFSHGGSRMNFNSVEKGGKDKKEKVLMGRAQKAPLKNEKRTGCGLNTAIIRTALR